MRKIGIRFLFLVVFATSLPLHAEYIEVKEKGSPMPGAVPTMTKETCGKVDLTDKMGPVRNQTGGTCYAYAATELLNFNKSKTYSALFTAAVYDKDFSTDKENGIDLITGFNGGSVQEALKRLGVTGMCPEENVPSIDPNHINRGLFTRIMNHYQASKKVDLYTACVQDYDWWEWLSSPLATLDKHFENNKIENAKKDKDLTLRYLRKYFPSISDRQFEMLYKTSANEAIFMNNVIVLACSGYVDPIEPAPTTKSTFTVQVKKGKNLYNPEKRLLILQHLNEALEKGIPASMSYYTRGLIQPSRAKNHEAHSSVVVGRAWREEVKNFWGSLVQPAGCYYLVKNSWGENWDPPANTKALAVTDKPGHFLVSEKDLLEHAHEITTVE